MPELPCGEVPCKQVDDRLQLMWDCIKAKVPSKDFKWIIGALAGVLLIFILIQLDMRGTMVKIQTTLEVNIEHQAQLHKIHDDRILILERK